MSESTGSTGNTGGTGSPEGDRADTIATARMSDEAMTTATGRPEAHWFELLDAAGAAEWTHPQIARWLHDDQGVPGWWSQAITVGFEQARGRRVPGQRADGTFEVSASKTFPLEQQAALDAVIGAVSASLGRPASESRAARYPTARWTLPGNGSLLATANPARAGRTSVSLARQRLADAAALAAEKAALRHWLAAASSGAARGLD